MLDNEVRTVNILAHEYSEGELQAVMLMFKTDKPAHEVPDLIRKAVEDFVKTPNGEALLDRTCDNLNYGDLADVPNEYFERYGLKLLSDTTPDITVDLGESLLP